MRTLLSAVFALGFTVSVFADQGPVTNLGTAPNKGLGKTNAIAPDPVNPGDEICNYLDITNNQRYDNGYANIQGALNVFGCLYDPETAQICLSEQDCELSDSTFDNIDYYGATPRGVQVGTFDANGCNANNTPYGKADVGISGFSNFSDTRFGLVGKRITAAADGAGVPLPAGLNAVQLQEINDDDYGFVVILQQRLGACNTVSRDGPELNCQVFGFTSWTDSARWIGVDSTASVQINAKCGPPTPRCIYQVSKVKNLATVCGKVCDACPYVRGDLVCLKAECRNNADCASKLKGWNACPNGAACKVIGSLLGCDIPPRNCKRCR